MDHYASWNPTVPVTIFKISASQIGEHKCELNNATHEAYKHDLEENPNYLYRGVKVKYLVKMHGKKACWEGDLWLIANLS